MTADDPFVEHRGLLFTVAYEMLGSAADAEDVLQESWLRWAARTGDDTQDAVRDPRAYLVRVVTHQALNRLRTLQRQRETYVGPWLPEPLATAPDVLDHVELAESVSFAMLLVLETLSPLERAAFVLREVFGFEYDEIATTLDRAPAAVRQLVSRARNHVQARRPRFDPPADAADIVTEFFAAATTGQVEPLLALLAPDVVLHTDGGGKKKAALNRIHGAEKVARFIAATAAQSVPTRVELAVVNGAPALLVYLDDELDTVGTVTTQDGRIKEIYLVRNPDKLVDATTQREIRIL